MLNACAVLTYVAGIISYTEYLFLLCVLTSTYQTLVVQYTISVFNKATRPTQPGHPSVGRQNEY